jgi:hypothetical protein
MAPLALNRSARGEGMQGSGVAIGPTAVHRPAYNLRPSESACKCKDNCSHCRASRGIAVAQITAWPLAPFIPSPRAVLFRAITQAGSAGRGDRPGDAFSIQLPPGYSVSSRGEVQVMCSSAWVRAIERTTCRSGRRILVQSGHDHRAPTAMGRIRSRVISAA